MSKKNYTSEATLVIEIIDLAVQCFKSCPPESFTQFHLDHTIKVYLGFRDDVINPEPKYRNLKSLNHTKADALTYFLEGTGKTVDIFWKNVYERKLKVVRENRFEKILKRGRIRDHVEYDIIVDLYNSYVETNVLSDIQIENINILIAEFENRPNRKL